MPARVRRTQEERSATTRALLLDATIECLVEFGYGATTTTVIAERAGVSRGAQLHHYPTKAELVAAAVEHLARRLGGDLAAIAASLPRNGARLTEAIDALWESYATPLFQAWLELWVASRTDPELRRALAPVDARIRRGAVEQVRQLLGPASDAEMELTFYMLQGLALARFASTESKKARDEREAAVLAAWKALVTNRQQQPQRTYRQV